MNTPKPLSQKPSKTTKKETEFEAETRLALVALLKILQEKPELWEVRKEAARVLFDNTRYDEASDLIWEAPEIPCVDLEIAFAARVLARTTPHRSIRLLKHVVKRCSSHPVKLLAIANALMHHGMVMQAARFYGAATICDESLDNADLEHFILWLDDNQKLWGDWEKASQRLDELPWVRRDKALDPDYEKTMSGLTTPIKVSNLNESTSEHLVNEYYKQVPKKGAEVTAPPAVTIPLDQLNMDDVNFDKKMGAEIKKTKKTKPIEKVKPIEKPEGIPTIDPQPPISREPILPKQPKREPKPIISENPLNKVSTQPKVTSNEEPNNKAYPQPLLPKQPAFVPPTISLEENESNDSSSAPKLTSPDESSEPRAKLLF